MSLEHLTVPESKEVFRKDRSMETREISDCLVLTVVGNDANGHEVSVRGDRNTQKLNSLNGCTVL